MKLMLITLSVLLLSVHSSSADSTNFLQQLLDALEYALKYSQSQTEPDVEVTTQPATAIAPRVVKERQVDCAKFCARNSSGNRRIRMCAGRRRKEECIICRVNLRCMLARGVVFS